MRVLRGSFKTAVGVALSCLCLLVGQPAAHAAETTLPDRQQALLDAVSAAQKKLADAVQAKKPADAEVAAQDVEKALAAYRAEPTAKDIADEATRLVASLAAYSGGASKDITDATDQLVGAIAIYRGLGADTFIATASGELTTWIGKTNWRVESDTAKLMTLAETIVQRVRLFNPDAAATSFKTMALAITGTDAKPTDFRPPLERSGYTNQIKLAWAPLNDQVRANFPVEWFSGQAGAIKALINSDDASANQLRRAQLLNNTDAMKNAAAAKDAITLLQGGYRPQIHIVDALYGDLPTGRYSKRVCNATRAMTTKCERQSSCHLDTGYTTALCGYDPIPAADDRTRAVAIQYACFTGGDAVWDRLAAHPLEDPFEYSDLGDPHNPATGFAILRGITMELRCPFDANAPTVTK